MRELPPATPGDNPNGVKNLDLFASEMDTRRDDYKEVVAFGWACS